MTKSKMAKRAAKYRKRHMVSTDTWSLAVHVVQPRRGVNHTRNARKRVRKYRKLLTGVG